jgi:hypothetical protein
MSDDPVNLPMEHRLDLPAESELGVFADYANIWHTPNTFVLDFASVRGPAQVRTDEHGTPAAAILTSRIGARIRIPPEQIFPLIDALRAQSEQWLQETGRTAPPATWVPPPHETTTD